MEDQGARRPAEIGERIEVRPAVGRYDDFYEVVGVKKPGGKGCWCMSYRDSRVPVESRPGYMRDLCATDPGPGVLVYLDDVVVGWCSIAPRSTYRRLVNTRTIPFVDDRDAWVAVCFVVRAGYRKRGLMHHLLAGAVEHARAHGAEVVEGYPADVGPDRVDTTSGYVGTVGMFEAAGFHRAAETAGVSGGRRRWVMRRELVPRESSGDPAG
ncbi:Acetyltransferase (GNAT) family protein [Promicromonospora umidemergens]|uniref:GNAT family N-acetyltransferase n=1 Tax=Promicromonospora umidemergens TaxID=629679 RepID=A0ABP8Y829_9MICO|nr:GNAT family N-acetyltransferase [Promicromonospora umidemergens]MCP2282497.1 Acetyltransferase (GNAT) family protein [Promicromonospora umidemergens]